MTSQLGVQAPPGLTGVHFNTLTVMSMDLAGPLDEEEREAVAKAQHFANVESAYARRQATRPQTIGYAALAAACAFNPVGLIPEFISGPWRG